MHETWKTTWGLLTDILERIKGPLVNPSTGLPTKDATSTTTVESLSSLSRPTHL